MCIGEVFRVVADDGRFAWCEGDGARECLDMVLVGSQPPGTWVLGFHGAARQVLGEADAAAMRAGRQALAALQAGEGDVDAFFADLVGREPQLPAHLRGDPA
ncbi:MAG: HypC/HybG/HupF family hydrogenase formation chaperone [Caldimonas sp.]